MKDINKISPKVGMLRWMEGFEVKQLTDLIKELEDQCYVFITEGCESVSDAKISEVIKEVYENYENLAKEFQQVRLSISDGESKIITRALIHDLGLELLPSTAMKAQDTLFSMHFLLGIQTVIQEFEKDECMGMKYVKQIRELEAVYAQIKAQIEDSELLEIFRHLQDIVTKELNEASHEKRELQTEQSDPVNTTKLFANIRDKVLSSLERISYEIPRSPSKEEVYQLSLVRRKEIKEIMKVEKIKNFLRRINKVEFMGGEDVQSLLDIEGFKEECCAFIGEVCENDSDKKQMLEITDKANKALRWELEKVRASKSDDTKKDISESCVRMTTISKNAIIRLIVNRFLLDMQSKIMQFGERGDNNISCEECLKCIDKLLSMFDSWCVGIMESRIESKPPISYASFSEIPNSIGYKIIQAYIDVRKVEQDSININDALSEITSATKAGFEKLSAVPIGTDNVPTESTALAASAELVGTGIHSDAEEEQVVYVNGYVRPE